MKELRKGGSYDKKCVVQTSQRLKEQRNVESIFFSMASVRE